jgi:hypothetical protein
MSPGHIVLGKNTQSFHQWHFFFFLIWEPNKRTPQFYTRLRILQILHETQHLTLKRVDVCSPEPGHRAACELQQGSGRRLIWKRTERWAQVTVLTKHGGTSATGWICSQSWKLEVWEQGTRRVGFPQPCLLGLVLTACFMAVPLCAHSGVSVSAFPPLMALVRWD